MTKRALGLILMRVLNYVPLEIGTDLIGRNKLLLGRILFFNV